MHSGMYAIQDMEAKLFHEPMCFKTDVDAKRFFVTVINDKNTFVAKFPNEHVLVKIGTYDNEAGKLFPMDHPDIIMLGEKAAKNESQK